MSCAALLSSALLSSLLATFATATPTPLITHVGRGTWFHPGLGNCGIWNNDNDPIVAIGKGLYDRNDGTNCGQYIEITNTANGKVAYGVTMDSCVSCSDDDLDMSPALFQLIGDLDTGVLPISWQFEAKGWQP